MLTVASGTGSGKEGEAYLSYLRTLVDSWMGFPFRWLLLNSSVRTVGKRLRTAQRNSGLSLLSIGEFLRNQPLGKAERMFILGSGPSVLSLSERQFEQISAATSVGINTWVLHDFVPDFFSYELVDDIGSDHAELLHLIDRKIQKNTRVFLFVLSSGGPARLAQFGTRSRALLTRTRLYGRIQPITRSAETLSSDLKIILTAGQKSSSGVVVPDSGASVLRMISLGLMMGYREIVLVGVDLNQTQYFWEIDPSFLQANGLSKFRSQQSGNKHETMKRVGRPFVVTEMIAELNKIARESYGATICNGSDQSLLKSLLPDFKWSV